MVAIATFLCIVEGVIRSEQKVNVFQQPYLHATHTETMSQMNDWCKRIDRHLMKHRFHTAGLPSRTRVKVPMLWTPVDEKQKRIRLKMIWCKTFWRNLTRFFVMWEDVEHLAKDCLKWRQAAA